VLEFGIDELPRALLVHVKGEVNYESAPQLEAHLADAVARRRHLIVDLSAMLFLDMSGVRALETARERCRKNGCAHVVIAPPQMPRCILEIIGFMQEVPVADSPQAELKLLRK